MANPLLLPLAVLLAFPGIPGLGKFRQKAAAPLDSLPPAWRSSSQLGLESSFVRAWLPRLGPPVGLQIATDPRHSKVAFDPDSSRVRFSTEAGNVLLGQSVSVPISEFSRELSATNFERLWRENSRTALGTRSSSEIGATGTGSGLSFRFPSPLPKRVQSWLGPGGPALTVSGSENIRISGTSQWSNQQIGLLGQSRSLFPSLDMQQDLDIRLEGQLSDRIKVNLLQNSAVQVPLANRIAINYRGDEDDLVQALDLGNTNLTLPGTQFVSYSGRNEGLFGAKFTTRLGPLDFTMLASKQEGRSERASYSGGTSKQTPTVRDLDYIKGVYFFFYDPNHDPTQVIDLTSIHLFLDPGIYQNSSQLAKGRAYINPNAALTDTVASGFPLMVRGNFRELTQGPQGDFEVFTDIYGSYFPVIRLKVPVSGDNQILGVSYKYRFVDSAGNPTGDVIEVGSSGLRPLTASGGALDTVQVMKVLRAPLAALPDDPDNPGFFDNSVPMAQVRNLELRNFYNLGGARIDPATLELNIRWKDNQPAVTANTIPGVGAVPLIEALGLDSQDESTGNPVKGQHDGRVDGTRADSRVRAWVDYENGILFFPELRPFDPALRDSTSPSDHLAGPFDRFILSIISRRDSLMATGPNDVNVRNPRVYERRITQNHPEDRVYSIDLSFTASRVQGEISLGRTNIVEGSDVVRVNNQTLVRDRDYRVDYDLGRITLIRQLGPSDQLDIDYAYAPLFSQAGKTLVGSAFRWEGRDKTFGGAFLYESKGAQDLRPRIGEEPSRLMIGDLFTEWRFRPGFLTRLVDALPGVRTTAQSEFNVAAEIGGSLPNPNTKNEVYLDDMEGVRDAVSLSMGSERWRWSSVPRRLVGSVPFPIDDATLADRRDNVETHWYTPVTAIKERDLKPTLTNAEGAQNVHASLAMSLPRRPATVPSPAPLWAGLTYVLDPVGLDLSRSQFLELWVNDFRDFYNSPGGIGAVRGRHVKLHVDIGVVDEDQQRAPNVPPNTILDTEDRNNDNQLQVNTDNEDTGVDQQLNPEGGVPYDLTTASPTDLHGDDFQRPNQGGTEYGDLDPRKWKFVNGSEDNHEVVPIPDTEDLNLNSRLDSDNNYYEYTIDLGEADSLSRYFVDAAYAPGRVYLNDGDAVPEDNGWRRFRIPIADSLRATFGRPDLALTRHVRVWIEDMVDVDPPSAPPLAADDGRPFLMLGGLEIVGSRWVLAPLDTGVAAGGTTAALNALNTLDNADQYVPPFDPGSTRSGSQELARREQALVLEFENLQPGDSVETYKTFSIDEDYSRYGTLDWFVTGYRIAGYHPAADSLDYFVRFASDERGQNYYEYRARVPMSDTEGVNWQEVRLPLTNLSNLKLNPGFPQTGLAYYKVAGANPGETYIINGRPSFTRLRRISFGVIHRGPGAGFPAGQVWFNELRALDIARDADLASRVQVNGRFANLLNYNVTYNGRGADFQQVGEARGRGSEQSSLTYTVQADLHRFFEATGIVLPIAYNYTNDKVVPRYTAGDDVFRSGAAAEFSTSRRITRSFSTSYARSWSDRSNPFLRYTIGGITASYGRTVTQGLGPSGADTAVSNAGTVNWLIAPRELFSLRVIPTKLRLYPLPERVFWNYRINTTNVHNYYRLQDGTGTLVPSALTVGRAAFIDFGASTRPFDFLHHDFSATRNQTLPEPLLEHIGPVNLGRVVGWRQSMDARLALQRGPQFLRPTVTWASNFQQNNPPELSPDLSVRAIGNGQSITMSMTFPFNTFMPRMSGPPPMVRKVVMRADSTGRDSARADTIMVPAPRRPSFSVRRLIARLGAIQTDARYVQGSGYSRLTGSPDPLYIIGVTQNPGLDSTGRMQEQFSNVSSFQDEFGVRASAGVDIGFGATVRLNGDLSGRRSETNRVVSRSQRLMFPDLSVEYGRIPDVVLLSKILRNPLVRTSYARSQNREFANNRDDATLIATSSDWKPLIGVSGDLKNGTRAEVKVERRVTVREDNLYINTITTDRNTDFNFSLSRRYTSGQKVKVFGKESTVRTSVSMQLSGSYSKRSGETETVNTGRIQGRTEADRLSVNATGSYGFSSNVTGNLDVGFLQDRNIETRITNRSVRIEARAQFTF